MQSQKYTLQCLVQKVLWRSIKYWHEDLEEKVVKKALKTMSVKKKADREKHRDYTCAFLQDLIIVKRNNSIASLKKAVVNTKNVESK
jgi:hypothetical protein